MERDNVIKVVESLFEDWIDKNINAHPLAVENMRILEADAIALLKEQELPTELKQKMWNALYTEEDKFEKKYVGTKEHNSWFLIYRPWLQKGFDIAINVIADWEGR